MGDYGENWYCFAEYMIVSDSWTLRKAEKYEIVNTSYENTVLSHSLVDF
jgi:hypothetical protein